VPKNDRLEILSESADWIAVMKPAGLASIPGRGEDDSVLQQLAAQTGLPAAGTADPRLRVVHRLDKDTSGVLLLAKNLDTQRHLSHQFQNNAVHKEYLAIVAGSPGTDEGEIDAPLGPHPANPKRMTVLKHGGRPARTLWKVEQRFRGLAVLRVLPKTGKTHQIRVHLKHAGMPLAVDPLYNPPRGKGGKQPAGVFLSSFKRDYRPTRGEDERPLIDRLTLHAEKLRFRDRDEAEVEVVAPLPKDLRATLNQLSRHGRG
jgi:23S rRNA pseudouridine955/2504/2580 synthase/23S rRNA pseudouridine1911/1915/1917 synthase